MKTALPATEILQLGNDFYVPVNAAQFPQALPRFLNQQKADELGLKLTSLELWKKYFHQFTPLDDNLPNPLALRYHGHQFQHYNPDLGDGRGFLFAQYWYKQKLLDLGTKGSGQTPYSRAGDGKLTLKGAFREALATEMLESLGVNTSKTFCFFETGEQLERNDEPSPTRSAVLTRLSHSHIRFGTFQRLAYLDQMENIKKLVRYCIKNYYPHCQGVADFYAEVCKNTARTTAQWMLSGFVHGVLNTDNMNITGESFDYGPYRFLPTYNLNFTAAYFDRSGLYCYGRQPLAVIWNLQRLGEALRSAFSELQIEKILSNFQMEFNKFVQEIFFSRLNLQPLNKDSDEKLLVLFFKFLQDSQVPFEQFFFDIHSGVHRPHFKKYESHKLFAELLKILKTYDLQSEEKLKHPYLQQEAPCSLLIEEIEALWQKISLDNDWSGFEQKIQKIRSFRGIYNK